MRLHLKVSRVGESENFSVGGTEMRGIGLIRFRGHDAPKLPAVFAAIAQPGPFPRAQHRVCCAWLLRALVPLAHVSGATRQPESDGQKYQRGNLSAVNVTNTRAVH